MDEFNRDNSATMQKLVDEAYKLRKENYRLKVEAARLRQHVLDTENERLRQNRLDLENERLRQNVLDMEDLLRAARKDAERYKKLRHAGVALNNGSVWYVGRSLDNAVDVMKGGDQ